jgi:hypothetical protein
LTKSPDGALWIATLDDATIALFDVYEAYLAKGTVFTVSQLEHQRHSSLSSIISHALVVSEERSELNLTPDQARDESTNLIACYALGVELHDRRFQEAVAMKLIWIWMLQMPGAHQSQSFYASSRATLCKP